MIFQRTLASVSLFGLIAGSYGCATTTPPKELIDARASFEKARSGPASQVAMADLDTAEKSLKRAEASYKKDPESEKTRDLSYIAQRRAMLADAQGQLALDVKTKNQAVADYNTLSKNMTANKMASMENELKGEREARMEAERRAKEAMDKLSGFAAVKQDTRGTVITLSGSVLFATAKYALLPSATQRLEQVAEVLKQDKTKNITVMGFTDSQGNDAYNLALSQKRAEAVRNLLVSRGVPSDNIRATGMGKAQPIADNASPEGRANNRRVEILLADGPKSSTTTTTTDTTTR
jgi:outer membrane protein OmpA-like peptidoglycan-associated protein